MAALLDIAGSFIIGFIVLFLLSHFNKDVQRTNTELLYYNLNQLNIATSSDILEYDLYKVGYKVQPDEKVITANEKEIKYLCDLDNNGIIDSVNYFLGDSTENATINPNDRPLYRKVNSNTPQVVGTVTDLTFSYFDESGINEIPYNLLTNSAYRIEIRGVGVHILFETSEPINDVYMKSELVKKIFAKNLKKI